MRVSWNWLSEFVDLSSVGTPEKLAALLTSRGLEVESIEPQGKGFDKVVTAQILEKKPHPQADRLSLCKVTIGGDKVLDIVCGAQNMKAGDKVALAQIGAHLPNGLEIKESKIRGELSQGMLCSESELKLKDTSEGIIILPSDTALGQPLAQYLNLNDTILTLKLTANRSDCLSHRGLAREVASALGQKVKSQSVPHTFKDSGSPISVDLEAGADAPQFYGAYIEGVKIGPSPKHIVSKLEKMGLRSINNVVDATNIVMLELGHPVHAYDAEKIENKKIGVRIARSGEKLPLLDGTEVELQGFELVIFDGARSIGLAGVMGGGNSEVSDTTRNIFLECAEFAPSKVRKASAKHQKKTDAAHRFERGIDSTALEEVISRLTSLVIELAGGTFKGGVKVSKPLNQPKAIEISPNYFTNFLGFEISPEAAEKVLTALEMKIEKKASTWFVTPPAYRRDIEIQEDLAEEIARSLGFDAIPATIPVLTTAPTAVSSSTTAFERVNLMDRAKDLLVQMGLNETLNFAFTRKSWLEKFGFSSSAKVLNPLSEEHEALVPSLLPGLLKNAIDNWRHHFGSEVLPIRLFELRPVYQVSGTVQATDNGQTGVQEVLKLAFLMTGPKLSAGMRLEMGEVDLFDAKAVLERLIEGLGLKGVRFVQPRAVSGLYHPGQCIDVMAGNQVAGTLGLIHPTYSREFKMRTPVFICELDWSMLAKLARSSVKPKAFKGWGEFPHMERDFALLVKSEITAEQVTGLALKAGRPIAKGAKVFDIYRGAQVAEGMTSVAVRVIFYEESRSLTEAETEGASAKIVEAFKKELGAQLR